MKRNWPTPQRAKSKKATDLDTFVAMLRAAGIAHTMQAHKPVTGTPEAATDIVLEAQTPNVFGYVGFVAVFMFTADGKLSHAGVWE